MLKSGFTGKKIALDSKVSELHTVFCFFFFLMKISWNGICFFQRVSDLKSKSYRMAFIWIPMSQCWSFIISLLLRFYTKSIFWYFWSSKNWNICHFSGFTFCWFSKFQLSKSAKTHKNQTSETLNVLEICRILDSEFTNFDFT